MDKYYFLLKTVVDKSFSKGAIIDTDAISESFQSNTLRTLIDDDMALLLTCSGFIPDVYGNDSSEETLFTKLVEVLVSEWAIRMGFESRFVKQKASYEDVNITINGKVVVCDAKSFRLGRSQAAPNVKDFLKLEDIRKWLFRYKNKLGGLVTYPDTHEWSIKSDAYQYCSTKDAPTIMLPYKYLSFLLINKANYDVKKLESLWDYERLFPNPLSKDMPGGNRDAYWSVINNEIINITGLPREDLQRHIQKSDTIIRDCVQSNLLNLEHRRQSIINKIRHDVDSKDIENIREDFAKYMINAETSTIDVLIARIKKFRL